MAPPECKLPVTSIHIDLKRPEPMGYIDAYLRDVERHAIGTGGLHPLHPDVSAGIYFDGTEIVWKIFELVAAPAATAPAQSAASYGSFGGVYTLPSHALAGSWTFSGVDLRQEVAAHSALGPYVETPPPGPPADYMTDPTFFVPESGLDDQERTPLLYIGRYADLPAPTGRPSRYSYSARLALFPDNSHYPVSAVADGRPKMVVYDLELDTGGLADSWVFGNLLWQSFMRVDPKAKYTMERLQADFARKMKMPFPAYEEVEADRSTLHYGAVPTAPITVLVKSGRCGIAFAHWEPRLRIENFTIGVVYGSSDSEVINPFDGLLGLGRGAVSESRVNPQGRYGLGITLPEAAWRQGLIKDREFWIHIADPTWDDKPEQSFMCLGTYHNPFDSKRVPTWLDVDCVATDPDWRVTITKITVYDPEDRRRPRPNLLEHDFIQAPVQPIVDSGCTQTYMPGPFVNKVEEMFHTEFDAPLGSASYTCPESLVVCFHFMSGGQVRAIEGQAIRFFISPNYVDADHPALSVKRGDRAFLGLNFFRTFIIGFRDDDSHPKLTIGKHRGVRAGMKPRLACRKGPSDRERKAGASTSTRPAPGPNRRAPDPRPTVETGGRGNPNPSRLRKPSVSAPAKDARSDGKGTGHRRTQSEQIPFPPYRAPLPGEDEGQGSSRRRGSNAPVPQEAAYNRRTGRRPSESYTPAAPPQFQQPANAGGAGWNPPPAQRTRGNSLSYGAPRSGPPPAQPVPGAQQQWAQPGAMYPPGGAPLQRTTSQPLAPIGGSRRPRPPALPIPVPPPVAPPQTSTRQPRARTSSLTTGLKNLFGIGGKKPGKR